MTTEIYRSARSARRWWPRTRLAPLGIPLLLGVIAVSYVVVPVSAEVWLAKRAARVEQVIVPLPELSIQRQQQLQLVGQRWDELSDGRPLLLTYHDVDEDPESQYSVTPEQLAEQFAALKELGVTALSAAQFVDYLHGAPIPQRSVMITFDDGARGVWRYADRLLEQSGLRAVAFVITGFVGTNAPYYMTWTEIETMAASGRWDIESHTHKGHRTIQSSPDGDEVSFLGGREYDEETGFESIAGYEDRVRTDLQRSIDELDKRGLGRSGMFAFPFSDFGRTNDVQLTLQSITRDLYEVTFNDDVDPLPQVGTHQFNRLSINLDTSVDQLLTNALKVFEMNASR